MFIQNWKKDLFTIPNLLSLFRLILIPVYVIIYLNAEDSADYFVAAMRAGLTAGLPVSDSGEFQPGMPATAAEAAVLLQNALDLTSEPLDDTLAVQPVWAADAVSALAQYGISLPADAYLTRGQTAQLLYQASLLADTAPGLQMYR